MRKLIHMAATTLILGSLIACEKENTESATIVKDCTGTYLQLSGKDYHVCNPEMVSSFPDGVKVTATFRKIKICNGSARDAIVCMMVHEHEGWIEVKKIK